MSGPIILMYHAFGERDDRSDPHRLFVAPDDFAWQLDTVLRVGLRPLTLDAYLAGQRTGSWPAKSVLITIDDGYVSTLDVAVPALAERGVPATLFALPGRLGGRSDWMADMADEPLLDAAGLRAVASSGVDVQAHGWDHALLPGLPADQLHRQVSDTRDALEDLLGAPPRAYAYASGQHDERARDAVRAAGYEVGFAVHSPQGRFAVRRTDVNATETRRTFRLKISPLWRVGYATAGRLGPVRRAAHAVLGSVR